MTPGGARRRSSTSPTSATWSTPAAAVRAAARTRSARSRRPHRRARARPVTPRTPRRPGGSDYDDEQDPHAVPRGGRRRVQRHQDEGGADLDDDQRRCRALRERARARSPAHDRRQNQRWDVSQAIEWMRALDAHDPLLDREPTSPDDVLGAPPSRERSHRWGRHGRARAQPRDVQAAASGRRRSACARSTRAGSAGQRGPSRCLLMAAHRGRCGVPARGRRRVVRVRVAHRAVRLHRGVRLARRAHVRVGRSLARDTSVGRSRWPEVGICLPGAPGYGVTMRPDSLEAPSAFPDGPVWRSSRL